MLLHDIMQHVIYLSAKYINRYNLNKNLNELKKSKKPYKNFYFWSYITLSVPNVLFLHMDKFLNVLCIYLYVKNKNRENFIIEKNC